VAFAWRAPRINVRAFFWQDADGEPDIPNSHNRS
jgi:hypothetical protein